jgi:hypothetical protein
MSPLPEPIYTPLNQIRGIESDLINSGFSETGDVGMLGDQFLDARC